MSYRKIILYPVLLFILTAGCTDESHYQFDTNSDEAINENGIYFSNIGWTHQDSDTISNLNDVIFIDDKFIIVGGDMGGSDDLILTSEDGIVWDQIPGLNQASLNAIAFGDGNYVAVGNYGTMYISTDALSWIEADLDTDHLCDVAYGNNRFVVIGYRDSCVSIDNGFTWDCQNRETIFYSIAYGNGTFVSVGGDMGESIIATSNDGVVWTEFASGALNTLLGVTYGNGTFIAVGQNGTILVSTDGLSWTGYSSGTTQDLFDISFGNDTFIAGGGYGTLLVSEDNGFTWEMYSSGKTSILKAMAFGNGFHIVVGNSGVLLKSYKNEHLPICPTPPQLYINKGAVSTTSHIVSVHVFAPADMAVSAYYVSETAATPAANDLGWKNVIGPWDWMSPCFATEIYFTLSEGTGTKIIYVWFKNATAVVSEKASASITLLP